jgi:two-component system response regulator
MNNNDEIEILLVEDNMDDANLTIRALRKHNLANNLTHLQDGQAALDFIFSEGSYSERGKILPRVILLDLKMPKVSGIEVLRAIKENDFTRKVPVIVLTSSKEDPDIQACYQLGVNSYIVKPVDFESFITVVAELGLYWLVINEPFK